MNEASPNGHPDQKPASDLVGLLFLWKDVVLLMAVVV